MPNIKFTNRFKNDIISASLELFQGREAGPLFDTPAEEYEAAKSILDAFLDYHGYADQWAAVPEEWLALQARVSIKRVNGYAPQTKTSFDLGRQMAVPRPLWVSSNNHIDISHPSLDAFTLLIREWETDSASREQEPFNFADKIETFMHRHADLMSAMCEWPQFYDLVPQMYRDRYMNGAPLCYARGTAMSRFNERTAGYTSLDFDALSEELAALLVAAKLSGAS